jgi:predicted XRE-type DNA-binding protein
MRKGRDIHSGSTLDSFLEEEGLLHNAEVIATKRLLAWQLEQAMKARRVSKKDLARLLKTSRSQVDRILDPEYVGVSLESVSNTAQVLGRRIELHLVDEGAAKKSNNKSLIRAGNVPRSHSTRRRVAAA